MEGKRLEKEEQPELDSDNEAVANMHEGIRKILSKQVKARPRKTLIVPEHERHILHCSKILKLDVQRKLISIVVEKSDGGLRQIRIEAFED